MYSKGDGVPQDKAEAARLFRLAAFQGIPSAQSNLAVLYALGEGVLKDNVKAYTHANIGCALSNENG